MKLLSFDSLSRKLSLLVMFAVLPALVILLYSGIEQRQQSIASARSKVFNLTQTMATAQKEITYSTKNILSTLSLLPQVQAMDAVSCSELFKDVLEQNPAYNNISLIKLNGDVLASGRSFTRTNLADRKHIREVLEKKDFAVGEYIISRVGSTVPAFAFAYPVFDKKGRLKAILTAIIKLSNFSHFHDTLNLPERSFISITDHQGIRLFYYPAQNSTNPVGKPIKAKSWQIAKAAKDSGIFISTGSDGRNRIFAFEPIRLKPENSPFLYVWAGIPEAHVLGPANAALIRNLVLMFIVTVISFLISWVIGKSTETLIGKLETASKEIKTLRGIIPICSFCKKIRNDDGFYEQLEEYFHKHSDTDFSHTVCPLCLEEHYPEEYQNMVSDKEV